MGRNAVKSAEVVADGPDGRASQVAFTPGRRGCSRDAYTLAYDWAEDGLSVSWGLVKGQIQKAPAGLLRAGSDRYGHHGHLYAERRAEHPDDRPCCGRKAEKIIIDTAPGRS